MSLFGLPVSGSVKAASGGGGTVYVASTRTPAMQGGAVIVLDTGNQFVIATSAPFAIAAGQKLVVWYSCEWQSTGGGIDDVSFSVTIDNADPGSDIATGNNFGVVNGQAFRDVLSWVQEFDAVAIGNHVVRVIAQSDNGGSLSQINATRLQLMVA